MLPPRVAVAVCHASTHPGETLDPGHRPRGETLDPGHRPRGKTLPGDAEVQRERDTSTPGRTGRSRDTTREPSTAERIQLGFDSRFAS